jgi:ABC-type branched-subunit amino acid transport system substrate-binding protein
VAILSILSKLPPSPFGVFAVLAFAACGPKPAPYEIDQRHVSGEPRSAGDAAAAMKDAVASGEPARILGAARAITGAGGDLAPWRADVWAAIDRADEVVLVAAARDLGADEPAAAVNLRLAFLADHRGEREAVAAYVAAARAAADFALAPGRERADALEPAPLPDPDPAVIALLLPTSGPHGAIGTELAAAAKLAAGSATVLVVLDTKGEPAGAVAAVDAAVAKRAVAIIGPVGEKESLAAARRAAEVGIPIGLLAPADGADPAAGVFRLVSSPADEARMAAWLAEGHGFPTAGILVPRDDVGAEAADAFAAAAAARGIAITARGDYDPSAQDLEPDVKKFLGLDPLTNERLRAHLRRHGKKGWQTFSPDVPFSLLYLPDRYDHAALVAAFLPYLGVELRTSDFEDPEMLRRKHRGRIPQVVQLLGDSGWNDPRLVVNGGSVVEGALIVTTFGGELDSGPGGELAARFREKTGHVASAAAAQAHDAVLLVELARARSRVEDVRGATARWAAMRQAMVGARLDDGACGPAEIDRTGEVLRDPVVLQVESGELVLAP